MSQSRFPAGWGEDRVRRLLAHYEQQMQGEAVAEDEAAFAESDDTVMKDRPCPCRARTHR